jgi:Tol biopolymer transport system component
MIHLPTIKTVTIGPVTPKRCSSNAYVSPDGTRLIFTQTTPKTGADVMQLRLDMAHPIVPEPLVQTPFAEQNGEVSPNGRWLAYEANDSGAFEIYVRPFPEVKSGHWQVSTGGGTRPLWSRAGQELLYAAPTGELMRVGFENGPSWSATPPTKALDGRYYMPGGAYRGRTYDESRDGQRFLMIKPSAGPESGGAPAGIVVVQNWFDELKRLLPVGK